MKSEKPEGSRPPSLSCTPEPTERRESKPCLAGLMTPWEEFYRRQRERLSRIAADMGVPPDQIADVLQEAQLDTLKHSEGFQGADVEQRLSSWLGKVVRSKSRNALRSLSRRRRIESLDALPVEPADCKMKEPAELMAGQERYESLGRQLDELRQKNPLNCRLLYEHFLEGRSLQTLSVETGLVVHAISCRIGRALKMLRRRLQE